MALIKVASVNEVQEGQSKLVDVNGTPVSLWKIEGQFHAIANTCPHAGGPLNEGILEEEKVVMCPWHGWKFSVVDGKSPVMPNMSIPVYTVKVEGEDVFVEA